MEKDWKRLAVDETHYRQGLCLCMVNCGTSRSAILKLRAEHAEKIAGVFNEILERGPVDEVLMDKDAVFQ